MEVLHFDVHGVKIKISTKERKFAEFIKKNYSLFHGTLENSVDIEIRFSHQAGKYAQEESTNHKLVGNNIYLSENSIYWENEFGFHILVEQSQKQLTIHGFHEELLKDQTPEERYKNFQRCMRFTMHYPLFTLLQYNRSWNLLHGAAVTKNGSTVVLCGLNKVGKSTIATHLCRNHGYDILTDNFLLFDDRKIYAFPEVIRLGPKSAEEFDVPSLWDHTVYDKYHISPSTLGVATEATPDAFFILSQGPQVTSEQIKPKNAWQCMQNLHSMLSEFPQHGYLAVWPLISGETMDQFHRNAPIFDAPWYSLSYKPNWKLDEVIDEVKKCI